MPIPPLFSYTLQRMHKQNSTVHEHTDTMPSCDSSPTLSSESIVSTTPISESLPHILFSGCDIPCQPLVGTFGEGEDDWQGAPASRYGSSPPRHHANGALAHNGVPYMATYSGVPYMAPFGEGGDDWQGAPASRYGSSPPRHHANGALAHNGILHTASTSAQGEDDWQGAPASCHGSSPPRRHTSDDMTGNDVPYVASTPCEDGWTMVHTSTSQTGSVSQPLRGAAGGTVNGAHVASSFDSERDTNSSHSYLPFRYTDVPPGGGAPPEGGVGIRSCPDDPHTEGVIPSTQMRAAGLCGYYRKLCPDLADYMQRFVRCPIRHWESDGGTVNGAHVASSFDSERDTNSSHSYLLLRYDGGGAPPEGGVGIRSCPDDPHTEGVTPAARWHALSATLAQARVDAPAVKHRTGQALWSYPPATRLNINEPLETGLKPKCVPMLLQNMIPETGPKPKRGSVILRYMRDPVSGYYRYCKHFVPRPTRLCRDMRVRAPDWRAYVAECRAWRRYVAECRAWRRYVGVSAMLAQTHTNISRINHRIGRPITEDELQRLTLWFGIRTRSQFCGYVVALAQLWKGGPCGGLIRLCVNTSERNDLMDMKCICGERQYRAEQRFHAVQMAPGRRVQSGGVSAYIDDTVVFGLSHARALGVRDRSLITGSAESFLCTTRHDSQWAVAFNTARFNLPRIATVPRPIRTHSGISVHILLTSKHDHVGLGYINHAKGTMAITEFCEPKVHTNHFMVTLGTETLDGLPTVEDPFNRTWTLGPTVAQHTDAQALHHRERLGWVATHHGAVDCRHYVAGAFPDFHSSFMASFYSHDPAYGESVYSSLRSDVPPTSDTSAPPRVSYGGVQVPEPPPLYTNGINGAAYAVHPQVMAVWTAHSNESFRVVQAQQHSFMNLCQQHNSLLNDHQITCAELERIRQIAERSSSGDNAQTPSPSPTIADPAKRVLELEELCTTSSQVYEDRISTLSRALSDHAKEQTTETAKQKAEMAKQKTASDRTIDIFKSRLKEGVQESASRVTTLKNQHAAATKKLKAAQKEDTKRLEASIRYRKRVHAQDTANYEQQTKALIDDNTKQAARYDECLHEATPRRDTRTGGRP